MRRGNFKDGILRPEIVKRVAVYAVLTIVLATAQSAFFPLIDIIPATPDLLMGMILAIALIDSYTSAAIVAVCAGYFIDVIGSTSLFISPLIYFIFAVIMAKLAQKVMRSFASYLLLMIPMILYRGCVTLLCLTLRGISSAAFGILYTEALSTALFCLPIYFIVKLLCKIFASHGRFTF